MASSLTRQFPLSSALSMPVVGVTQAHRLLPRTASGVTGAATSATSACFSTTLDAAFPRLGAVGRDQPLSVLPPGARPRSDSAEASEEQDALRFTAGASCSFLGGGNGDEFPFLAPPSPTAVAAPASFFAPCTSSSLAGSAAGGFSGAFRNGLGEGFRSAAGALLPPGTSTGLASASDAAMLRDLTRG